ncbi:serine/threonine protein kinase [Lentzea guizhouensis]|uniref:Serine/threonine protein kinase n=1 Tax=Lentzea guizhouensis TaxID=1586287 RepID=A0A1B2HS03_9PSEU|nr:ATP-binding protein [Lentzea guizhouensis]ANZ40465.1 serine/threonine protein kinase [Lentzea guizhouensis]
MRPGDPPAQQPPTSSPQTHRVASGADLLAARQAVRAAAVAAGFDLIGQTKVVTAASELVRNAYIHGGGGTMDITPIVGQSGRLGLRLRISDDGPGILDVDAALADGFSTSAGLGHGLDGTRRLVDEFHIDTAAGAGTTVTVVRWAP